MRRFVTGLLDVKHHIAARIFVAMFCCLYAVMLIFMIVFYGMNRGQIQGAMRQTAGAMLEQSHEQLAATLQEVGELNNFLLSDRNVNEYLLNIQDHPPGLSWFSPFQETLNLMRNYIIGRSRIIVGMGIVKSDGQTCYTGTMYAPIHNPDDSLWQSGMVIVPEYPYYLRLAPALPGTAAVVVTQLAQDFWAQVYTPNVLEQHILAVYDAQGQLVFTTGNYESLLPAAQARMRTEAGFAAGDPDGWDGALMVQARQEELGLVAVVAVPGSVIGESLVSLNRQLGVLLVLLFFTAVFLSRLLALSITRNVKILKQNAEWIGEGAYDKTVPIPSQDEMGELGQTIQELAARIELLVADINRREARKREMELQILRAQISPHFLYNSLNTISYLAMLQGAGNIGEYTASLIELLQAALQISDVLIPLSQELSYVRSYHEIMRYRCVYSIDLELLVGPEAQGARVMRMLLQPIVENAIIHGITPQQQDGRIRITVEKEMGDLLIQVTDNGSGMTREQIAAAFSQEQNRDPMRFSGIGIRNVQDRIRLQFGEGYGLAIHSEPDVYTTVFIRLPFIEGEEP